MARWLLLFLLVSGVLPGLAIAQPVISFVNASGFAIPLIPGSSVAFNDGSGARQTIPVSDIVSITASCRLNGSACILGSMDNVGGQSVVFANTFLTVPLQSGASMTIQRSSGPLVVSAPMFVDAQCTISGNQCVGVPTTSGAPTVSMSAGGFSSSPSGGFYPPGTSFTLSLVSTNAGYCLRQTSGPPTSFGGYSFPPFPAAVSVTVPAPNTTYSFLYRCFNQAGATSSATVTVSTTDFQACGGPPPGLSRQLTPNTYEQLFSGVFANTNLGTVDLSPPQYSAIALFVPPTFSGQGLFTVAPALSSAQAAMTLSTCPGDFSFGALSPACRRIGNGGSIAWRVGGAGANDCTLTPGTTYYLNTAFLNSSFVTTCGAGLCRAAIAQSDLVITQPIPTLAPGTANAPDVATASQLGASSAVGGTILAVGLPEADQATGRVFVYRRSPAGTEWNFEAELPAQGKAIGDKFGGSLAVSDDGRTIIVGMPLDDHGGGTDRGSARVLRLVGDTWSTAPQETILVASDAADGDRYGEAVDVSPLGNAFLIGAPFKNSSTGSAYFIKSPSTAANAKDGFVETAPIPLPAAAKASLAIGDKFGAAVATDSGPDGGRWIIGLPGRDLERGAVRTLRDVDGTFVFNEELSPPTAAPGDTFGSAVAVDGNKFAVGAPGDDIDPEGIDEGNPGDDRADQGSAAVIEYTQGDARMPMDVLAMDAGEVGDALGSTVAIRRDVVLAGGPLANSVDEMGAPQADAGTLAVFRLCRLLDCPSPQPKGSPRWEFVQQLTGADTVAGDNFGASLSFDGAFILVGAPSRGGQAGGAYLFRSRIGEAVFGDSFETP